MYRIYLVDGTLKLIALEYFMEDVIFDLDFLINDKKIKEFVVLENKDGKDINLITSVSDYKKVKEEIGNVSRGASKVYKR